MCQWLCLPSIDEDDISVEHGCAVMAMAGMAMGGNGKNAMMYGMTVNSMSVNNVVVFVSGT